MKYLPAFIDNFPVSPPGLVPLAAFKLKQWIGVHRKTDVGSWMEETFYDLNASRLLKERSLKNAAAFSTNSPKCTRPANEARKFCQRRGLRMIIFGRNAVETGRIFFVGVADKSLSSNTRRFN